MQKNGKKRKKDKKHGKRVFWMENFEKIGEKGKKMKNETGFFSW